MSKETKSSGAVEQNALSAIPMEERKGWGSIALIWAGGVICVPTLMVGGTLIAGLPFWQAILAAIIGYGILMLFMVPQGMQGSDLGRPTVVNARSAFGENGANYAISFVLAVSLMGWFGVQCAVTGSAFSSMVAQMGGTISVPISSALWGIIMLVTAIVGYKALAYLNYIAVPAIVLLAVYGMIVSLQKNGFSGITELQPASPMSFISAIAVVVGSMAVGGAICADYARYNKNRIDSAKSSIVGVMPMGFLFMLAGIIMSATAGTPDMTAVIAGLGMPVIGLIILILATWTTNVVNAYSGGIALTNLLHLKDDKRAIATAVAGVIGTIMAVTGLMNYFITFLSILTATICPLAGVMIADYWIRRKGKPEDWAPTKGINWNGIVSWLVASAVAYFVPWGVSAINGIVLSGALFLFSSAVFKAKKDITIAEKL